MRRIFLCAIWSFSLFVSLSTETARASYEYVITFLSEPPEIPPQWICNRVDRRTGDVDKSDLDTCLQRMKFEVPTLYTPRGVDPELRRAIRVDRTQNLYPVYPYLKTVFPNGNIVVVDFENGREEEKGYVNNFNYVVGYPGTFNELLNTIKLHNMDQHRARPYKSSEGISQHIVKKPKKQISAPGPSHANFFPSKQDIVSYVKSEKEWGKEEEKEGEYLTPELWLKAYTDCFLEREMKGMLSHEEMQNIQPIFPYERKSPEEFSKALTKYIQDELNTNRETQFPIFLNILRNELHKLQNIDEYFRGEDVKSLILRYAQKSIDLSNFESLTPHSVGRVMKNLVRILKSESKQEQHKDLFKIYAVIFESYYAHLKESERRYSFAMKLTINIFFTRLISPLLSSKVNDLKDRNNVRELQKEFSTLASKMDWSDDDVRHKNLRHKVYEHMSRNIFKHCPNLLH